MKLIRKITSSGKYSKVIVIPREFLKALSYVLIFVLILLSFFGGSYFEKQKNKTIPTPLISPIQNPRVI